MSKIIFLSLCLSKNLEANQEKIITSLPFGAAEKVRLESIKDKSGKADSLGALVALKEIASNNADLTISRTEFNKPFFCNCPDYFSLSHSNGISCAAKSQIKIGVDIELIDEDRDFFKLSDRFFNKSEIDIIRSSHNPPLDFYSIWTKKEALVKISGNGLSDISNHDSLLCFSHQYKLILDDKTFILTVCTEEKDEDITVNNPYKELIIYEL